MKYRVKKRLSLITAFILFLQLFTSIFPLFVFADNGGVLAISTTCNVTEAYTGDEFTYTLLYSYSNQSDASAKIDNVVIEDNLPQEVEYVSNLSSDDIENVVISGHKVTFMFKNQLSPGTTGMVKIGVKFPNGTTQDGVSVTNTASIKCPDISGGNWVTSNGATVTSKLNTQDWSINKQKTVPQGEPVPGQPVTYRLSVTGNTGSGSLILNDITMVDTLPAGAQYISSTGSGVYNVTSNTVTWNISTVTVGQTQTRDITVVYPEDTFTTSSTVINTFDCSAKFYGSEVLYYKQKTLSHGFTVPQPGAAVITKTSRQSNDEYSTGQTSVFYIGNIVNSGNVPLNNFVVEDILPPEIDVTSITSGRYSSGTTVTITYETNTTSATTVWGTYTDPDNTSLSVSGLNLQPGEYLTKIRWDFGTVPPGFSNNRNIAIYGNFKGNVAAGASITNSARLYASYGGNGVGGAGGFPSVSQTVGVVDAVPWIVPSISTVGASSFKPRDTVELNLRVENHGYATGDFADPVVLDVLDDWLVFDPYDAGSVTWDKGNTNITTATVMPSFSATETVINSTTKTVLKWSWSSESGNSITLNPGQYINIRFKAKVKDGTAPGTVSNRFYITTKGSQSFKTTASQTTDNGELISAGKILAYANTNMFIKFIGSISSQLLIKGELDNNWSTVTTSTLAGGMADYKLTVTNSNANGPIKNIVIIDKLPGIGDTGVVDTRARGTAWTPILVDQMYLMDSGGNIVDLQSTSITVSYSTNANPSCFELSNPINNINNPADGWTQTLPSDVTSVRSVKIDCRGYNNGNGLAPGESINLYWPMRAPVGAVSGTAWNSFGYGATYPDMGSDPNITVQQPFLPSEPPKVGFQMAAAPVDPDRYSIGDYVWEDMNKDGIQNDGNKGINNVLVKLYRQGTGTPVAFTRTGNDISGTPGYYSFPNQPSGSYYAEFEKPAGYFVTTSTLGNTSTDSDINESCSTNVFTLSSNKADIDAGFYRKASISGYVWKDLSSDGIRDTGEPFMDNVTVKLYDIGNNLIATTQTAGTGYYSFSSLDPGRYYINVPNPDVGSYALSPKDMGGNDTKDSDLDPATEKSGEINLMSGDNLTNYDTGLHKALLGGYVWHDLDGDGLQDEAASNWLNGVTVQLLDGNNVVTATTVTAAGGPNSRNGYYRFMDLNAGNYKVQFVKPAGYDKFSPMSASGTTSVSDSNADSTGLTGQISLAAGAVNNTTDAGVYKYVSVGDTVWNDRDADGLQDAGEPGIPGVTVELLDTNNNPVTTSTLTNANGQYQFSSLDPGQYRVRVTNLDPSSYVFSPKSAAGTTTSNDSNINVATGITDTFTLNSGTASTTIDAGMHKASFRGRVWHDINADGIQDGGEAGVSGVTVQLSGTSTATVVTNGSGVYEFFDLVPGDYRVRFVNPSGYYFSAPSATTDDKDSDADQATGDSDSITLAAGQRYATLDAGIYAPASIGNFVWEDLNGDGDQDGGENGISGVTVSLYKGASQLATTVTSASGNYNFTNLVPSSYTIRFTKPAGYEFTTPLTGGAAVDSNPDSDGSTAVVTVTSGQTDNSVDAGLYRPVSIGSIVWEDDDHNGIRDSGENGLAGITVNLYMGAGMTATTSTVSNGSYSFTNLMPGSYTVEFIKQGAYEYTDFQTGADSTKDSDAGVNGRTGTITLSSGQASLNNDAGLYRKCSIGDFVWLDVNGNGLQDTGESGVGGVAVKLYNSTGTVIMTATTTVGTTSTVGGAYSFENLNPGNYTVEFTAPSGYEFTSVSGGDAAKDSDAALNGKTTTITLVSGQSNVTIDGGLFRRGSIGDFVWQDTNKDGVQDVEEKGMNKVTVNLYNSSNVKVATTSTAADGSYLFSNIVPGNYTVEFAAPGGYGFTASYKGTDALKDSDAGPNGRVSVSLSSGEAIEGVDAGLYLLPVDYSTGPSYIPPSNVGQLVWEDKNNDGVRNPDEGGVGAIIVNLYNSSGSKVNSIVTDAKGNYSFANLYPGTYVVEIVLPDGYEFSSNIHKGGSDAEISKALNIKKSTVTLVSGEINDKVNAGIFKRCVLGNFVWEDTNKNGIQDPDEKGIGGVKVNLYDSNGIPVGSTTTAEDGSYSFANLLPGNYKVQFEKPKNYEFTASAQGGDTAKDSDPGIDGMTQVITLASGRIERTIAAGLVMRTQQGSQDQPKAVLPKTGSNYYNYLAVGCALSLISVILMGLSGKNRKRKPKH